MFPGVPRPKTTKNAFVQLINAEKWSKNCWKFVKINLCAPQGRFCDLESRFSIETCNSLTFWPVITVDNLKISLWYLYVRQTLPLSSKGIRTNCISEYPLNSCASRANARSAHSPRPHHSSFFVFSPLKSSPYSPNAEWSSKVVS